MKRKLLLGLALLLLLTTHIFAQKSPKKNVIKINVFSPFATTASLFYERALTTKISAQLGLSLTGASAAGVKYSGIGITPEVRFYLSKKEAPTGFFLGPFVRYRSLAISTTSTDAYGNSTTDKGTWSQVGGGVVTGYHWIWNWFSLDFFVGPGFYSNNITFQDGSSFGLKGAGSFSLRSGLTVGVAF